VNTFKHRSQGPPVAGPWVRPLWVALFLAAVICSITGCASGVPDNALQLSPETLEQRKLQTRRFDGIAEPEILSACAAVLQDLGFNLDESETELGVLVASKKRSARDARQIAAALLLEIVGWDMDTDEKQLIRASLVTRPADGFSPEDPDNSFYVRITFQRVVWNSNNEVSRTERLDEPELYQGFFDRLSKSVFLEGHKI
jgi:hypothetical protein